VMTTLPHSDRNSLHIQIRRTQPDIDQTKTISLFFLLFLIPGSQTAGCKCCLQRKSLLSFRQIVDSLQHDATGLHRHTLNIERRQSRGDHVSINKFHDSQTILQKLLSNRTLAGSICAAKHDH
jgi:hypothetical protein